MPSKTRDAEYSRRYRAEHREQIREKNRAYREAHREDVDTNARAYREAHRAELSAKSRAYRAANPDKKRAFNARRRELVRAASGSYTDAQWTALCAWFGNVCLGCGSSGPLTADHVVALTAGGSHNIDNIQPLCAACNSSKKSKTIDYRDQVLLTSFLQSLKD